MQLKSFPQLESPRWLAKMGRHDEARTILGRLRSEDGNPEAPRAVAEDRKSTRLNSSHSGESRMPSSA